MKKIFSLMAIAIIATSTFTSCKDDDKKQDDKVVHDLVLSIAPSTLAPGAKGVFTVTSDKDAKRDIVIDVVSGTPATATVPASVTLKKGTKTISGEITAVALGESIITISSKKEFNDVTIKTPTATVIVANVPDANNILVGTVNFTSTPTTVDDFAGFVLPSIDGENGEFQIGGIWVTDKTPADGVAGAPLRTSIENYGLRCVGVTAGDLITLSLIPAGTVIDNKLTWVANTAWSQASFWMVPVAYSAAYPTLAGQSGYFVMEFGFEDSANNIPDGVYRGWVQATISATGAITIGQFAICTSAAAFTTGQIE
ncbi:MAG: hypothetical protein RR132_05075 [Rikenellaceae bacterium]